MAAKFTSKTKWRAKLEKAQDRSISPLEGKYRERYGEGMLLIPTPLDVDAMIRKVENGKLVTMPQLREALARKFGAAVSCPLCTGIFVRIAAEASAEDEAGGATTVTPYWRVLTEDGRLNPKFPGGVEAQAKKLRSEGHRIVKPVKGKKPPAVEGFEACLARL